MSRSTVYIYLYIFYWNAMAFIYLFLCEHEPIADGADTIVMNPIQIQYLFIISNFILNSFSIVTITIKFTPLFFSFNSFYLFCRYQHSRLRFGTFFTNIDIFFFPVQVSLQVLSTRQTLDASVWIFNFNVQMVCCLLNVVFEQTNPLISFLLLSRNQRGEHGLVIPCNLWIINMTCALQTYKLSHKITWSRC